MSAPAPAPSPSGAPPEPPPPPPPPMEFFCYECQATVTLPVPVAPSWRLLCPLCRSDYLEENTSPSSPPPPPPLLSSGSDLSYDPDDPDNLADDMDMDPYQAHAYLSSIVHHHRLYDDSPAELAAAAAAAAAVLREHEQLALHHQPVPGGGEPPAPPASIAALPTVPVAEPAAVCAICKEDLPLASEARRLPCAHLYHSGCIVTWLELHNSCPVCRFRIPGEDAPAAEQGPPPTRITIRFTTTARRRVRVRVPNAAAPVSASPTQLAQAFTGDGAAGPANSGETVSSEWPPQPETDTVMSEARESEVDGFFD
ncbi:hypothetical protein U9M48_038630 [Paspalum notatum var. saurae]|uniref:RING-type domain-containing protein n=1 Tax=Paspalum notatum var. saurae TaxID=547442 RepID=A0AAQ3UHW2_PASNO